jgi:hypothetical protein
LKEEAEMPGPQRQSSGGKVRYVGTADVREISAADFRRAGVEGDSIKGVRWDAKNGKAVDREDLAFLSDEDFNRIIKGDSSFKVEEA